MTERPESPALPAGLLQEALSSDPARPLLTYYDDATGERVELSVATTENWVAKTANLLVDGLGLEPGARVALLLPAHWQTAVWLLACWSAGVVAAPGGDPAAADAAVTGPEGLARAVAAPEVVALSLRPLGAPFAEPLPGGVLDYATEVPAYADRFAPAVPPGAADPGLTLPDGTVVSLGGLVAAASAAAGREDLRPGDRILTDRPTDTLDGICLSLLAPLVLGGSVVLCPRLDQADASTLRRRIAEERVTVVADRCGTQRVG